MLINKFKKIIFLILILMISFNSYAESSVIVNNSNSDYFSSVGPGYASELVVAGDSYATHFYEDEKNRGIKLYGYFNEGFTLEMNRETLRQAFNSLHKIIFLSISVNDRHKSTHPSEFENELRELFDIAVRTNKIVLVHSYMYYDLASSPIFPYSTSEYDSMIRNLIMEYNNVYYIDMSDCVGEEYMLPDGIHYNKKFNDIMYDRLNIMIELIRNNFYE